VKDGAKDTESAFILECEAQIVAGSVEASVRVDEGCGVGMTKEVKVDAIATIIHGDRVYGRAVIGKVSFGMKRKAKFNPLWNGASNINHSTFLIISQQFFSHKCC